MLIAETAIKINSPSTYIVMIDVKLANLSPSSPPKFASFRIL